MMSSKDHKKSLIFVFFQSVYVVLRSCQVSRLNNFLNDDGVSGDGGIFAGRGTQNYLSP